jgi:hypothetical protein
MKNIDLHFLNTVLEDIEFLQNEWGKDITESQIRRNSPVLRYLLVEGKIKEAGAMLQQKIRIQTPLVSLEENLPELESVRFFMSGGASTSKGFIESVTEYNKALSAQEIHNMYNHHKGLEGKSKPVTVEAYLNQVSFILGNAKIKRKTVIKYICNKLGGTHYDAKRIRPSSDKTDIENEQYLFLDKIYSTWKAFDMNVIHLEMLGIGQRFVNSHDVHKLRKKIQKIISL